MKKTNEERLRTAKVKKPGFAYAFLGAVLTPIMKRKYGVHIHDDVGMKKVKEQHIFISNHTSRIDYFFNAFAPLPNKYNFIVGYNEFYRKQFVMISKLLHLIPKKNFVADTLSIKKATRIIKQGGNIAIFPEGMNSISGANQPVAIGTGKFLKHFNLPVYYSKIEGGYLTTPKYALNERPGRVDVTYGKLFTPEDLKSLTPEEIEDKINETLYHDAYAWNKIHGYSYKVGDNVAEGLETLLYKCPKCGGEFTMTAKGNEIRCTRCGNGARINDKYDMIPFDDTCVIPETQTEWFNGERAIVREEIKNPDFSFSDEVELGVLPENHLVKGAATSEKVGKGKLTIDRSGLTYDGDKNGEPYKFHIDSLNLPTYGMCTDTSRFYTFPDGNFVEFYPKTPSVIKFLLATEEIHRLNGGKWQDFKFEK